jgi:hypothetical protein
MNRCVLALAGLLAWPVCASAQAGATTPEPNPLQLPYARFAITPFIGARVPYTTGSYFVNAGSTQYRVEQDREGGYALGINAEARVSRALGVVGGLTYSGSAQEIYRFASTSTSQDSLQGDGPTYWFAKAGLSVRLPDPTRDTRRFHPSALITVAPALVIADYNDTFGGTSTNFAVNIGADAVARLGRGHWAISLGLDDYLTFWNDGDQSERAAAIWSQQLNQNVTVDFDYGSSNIMILKLGASYRP